MSGLHLSPRRVSMVRLATAHRMAAMLVVAAFCLSIPACGGGNSKVTRENGAKIKMGMSEKEITDILGSPTKTMEQDSPLGKMKVATWTNGDNSISVQLMDGKAIAPAVLMF